MENFKNIDFLSMLIASCCLTLYFLFHFGISNFPPKIAFTFLSVTFIIFSIYALKAIIEKFKEN